MVGPGNRPLNQVQQGANINPNQQPNRPNAIRLNSFARALPMQNYHGNLKLRNVTNINNFIGYTIQNMTKSNLNLNTNDKKSIKKIIENNPTNTVNQFYNNSTLKKILVHAIRANAVGRKNNNLRRKIGKQNNNNVLTTSVLRDPPSNNRNLTSEPQKKKKYIEKLLNAAKRNKKLLILYEITRKYVPSSVEMYKHEFFQEFIRRFLNNVKVCKDNTKTCDYNFYSNKFHHLDFYMLLWLDTYHDYKSNNKVKKEQKQAFPTFLKYCTKMNLPGAIELLIDVLKQNNTDDYKKSMFNCLIEWGLIKNDNNNRVRVKLIKNDNNNNNNKVRVNTNYFTDYRIDITKGLEAILGEKLPGFCERIGYKMLDNPLNYTGVGGVNTKTANFYMLFDQQQNQYFAQEGFNNLETLATLTDPGIHVKKEPNKPTAEKHVANALKKRIDKYMRFRNFYLYQNFKINLKFGKSTPRGEENPKNKSINIYLENPNSVDHDRTSIQVKTNWFGNEQNSRPGTASAINLNNKNTILAKLFGDLNQALTMCSGHPKNWYQATEDILHIYSIINLYRVSNQSPHIMTFRDGSTKYIVEERQGRKEMNKKIRLKRFNNNKSVTVTEKLVASHTRLKDFENIFNALPNNIKRTKDYERINIILREPTTAQLKKRDFLRNYLVKQMNKNTQIKKQTTLNNGNILYKNENIKVHNYLWLVLNKKREMNKYKKLRLKESLFRLRNRGRST